MNDFEYDCKCKKDIARSSHNHVSARRGKCRLPHEYLTRKELNALNGKVKTYDLGKPMDLYEFREMPDDLKKQYLEDLQERFHANDRMLGDMFGCGPITAGRERIKAGVKNLGRGHDAVASEDQKQAWKVWLGEDKETEELAGVIADTIITSTTHVVADNSAHAVALPDEPAAMVNFRVNFMNVHSWEELYALCKQFPFPEPRALRVDLEVR